MIKVKIKYMYLPLVCSFLAFSSCSKTKGCTDPDAENYNSSAEESDNSCLYSLIGVWNMTSYILNGSDATSLFNTYRITFNNDGSYYSEALFVSGDNQNGGDWIDVWGNYSITNQSSLMLQNTAVDYYNGNGPIINSDYSTFAVSELNNNSISIDYSHGSSTVITSLRISMYRP
tara:strand:+ start:88 stop:609 length:522 start_codon:yes stop_codon:yes gene_type:complete